MRIDPIFRRFSWVLTSTTFAFLVACGGDPGHEEPTQEPAPEITPPDVLPLVVSDPRRGEQLFTITPRPGTLICVDCHGENPAVNNFGNIWSGKNAVFFIQRAVSSNTGGMNRFASIYSAKDFADIAAFLGNTPSALQFAATPIGTTSGAQVLTVSTSTKIGIENLSIKLVGDFKLESTTCASSVPRFSSCTVSVAFRPQAQGVRTGAILLNHDGTPAPISIALSGDGL